MSNRCYSQQIFLSTIIVLAIFLLLALTGCEDHSNYDMTDSESDSLKAISLPPVKIGTDLDLNQLMPISKAYYEQTGVTIEWVKLDPDIFKLDDKVDMQLLQDIDLPEGLDMLLMYSTHTIASAGYANELQAVGSDTLTEKIPKQYQDTNGLWFGITYYARTLIYNKNKVNEKELVNYAAVSGKKWKNKLCMTDVMRFENQTIAKMMWQYRGSKLTPEILANWQRNMSRPSTSDQQVIKQIENGQCDVGIVNSDKFWQHAKTNKSTPVRLVWANQINRGALTDSISAGLVKTGAHVGQALRFMEWLASDNGQALLSFNTSTFPLVKISDSSINMDAIRPAWTKFEADKKPLVEIIEDKRVIEPIKLETDVDNIESNQHFGNYSNN